MPGTGVADHGGVDDLQLAVADGSREFPHAEVPHDHHVVEDVRVATGIVDDGQISGRRRGPSRNSGREGEGVVTCTEIDADVSIDGIDRHLRHGHAGSVELQQRPVPAFDDILADGGALGFAYFIDYADGKTADIDMQSMHLGHVGEGHCHCLCD